jgi:hypothetical protein
MIARCSRAKTFKPTQRFTHRRTTARSTIPTTGSTINLRFLS